MAFTVDSGSGRVRFAREIAQDGRHAVRLWAARPWHTAFAILALAIGIGANTGVFSVVDALLWRSLPFRDPDRLAALRAFNPPHDSAQQFHQWRTQSAYLSDAALVEMRDVTLGGADQWRRGVLAQTSWNFFQLLGTQPVLGRAFVAGDDVDAPGWGLPGRNAVAVIGYGLWQSLYGGDRKALGATIRVDGNPLIIIGVAPPGFQPGNAEIWKPAAYSRGNNGWSSIGRLKPGISWAQARSAFAAEAERLWPNRRAVDKIQFPAAMIPLREQLAGPTQSASLVLMACVSAILLIACLNVANLLMARTADRAGELSIRSALGASRARLFQQLLTECVLLSLVSAVAGIAVAWWTAALAGRLQPEPQGVSVWNGRVLAFGIAVSLLSGLLFGVLPSLFAGRAHDFGARGGTSTRGARLVRETLVAMQVMLTIVLLAGSISVGRAFLNLMRADRGFTRSGLATVNVSLEGTAYKTDSSRMAFFQEALARIRRLPGVRRASSTEFLPLYANMFMGGRWSIDGKAANENSMVVPVFSDYFGTMGSRILAGREFDDADVRSGAQVAVIDERLASEFGTPAGMIGRQLSLGRTVRQIVGVVRNMDYMTDGANSNEVFFPVSSPGGFFSTFVARVDGRAEGHLAMVRDAIQSVDRQVPLFGLKTMEQRMDDQVARPQFYRTAVSCFAAFAVLLAAIGIYGIVSYSVARRTREMGVRMALGTTPGRLRASLLREGLWPVAVGAVPGIALAVLSGRGLEVLVEGAKSVDPAVYVAAVLFIVVVAGAGIWMATRPVTRLDIVEILRAE